MATRANVNVEIPQEMIGSKVRFQPCVGGLGEDFFYPCIVDVYEKEHNKDVRRNITMLDRPEIVLEKKYISIYNHWDGYPCNSSLLGLGVELLRFRELDTALNLMLVGNISSITRYKGITPELEEAYAFRSFSLKGVNAEEYAPRQSDEVLDEQEWCYLFRNGEWWCKICTSSKWKRVKDYISKAIIDKNLD